MIEEFSIGFFLAIFLFAAGLLIVIIKRNTIFVLMGIELILNGANLNLITFSTQYGGLEGELMGIFVVVLAAAEAGIALAILLLVFKHYKSINLDDLRKLKY